MKTQQQILQEVIDRDFDNIDEITPTEWKAICLIAMDEYEDERVKFISINNLVLSRFPLGSKVRKTSGYRTKGKVVSEFTTLEGKEKLVIESDDNELRIVDAERVERDMA